MSYRKAYRQVRISNEAEEIYRTLLERLESRLADPGIDRNDLCREILAELYLGPDESPRSILNDPSAPPGRKSLAISLDPRNITLESEYYDDLNPDRWAEAKPLLWLWIMFDRSPLGHNVELGLRFRRVLAKHLFAECGDGVKIFRDVEFTYGYNLRVGDEVVMHHHVFLDDRSGITLGNRVSLSDYVNIYSHSHSLTDIKQIKLEPTVIGDGVRLTYHVTVLPGVTIGEDAMVGGHAIVTRDIPPHTVWVGVPAHHAKVKPGWEHLYKKQF